MVETKLSGLFLNTPRANCSIHESGKMCYDCLVLSKLYNIDYKEIDENNRSISLDYDFYIFNYHEVTMAWLDTKFVKKLPGLKATIVLEVLPNNPFVRCPKGHFDAYIVLDPTLQVMDANVFSFPRPLEAANPKLEYIKKEIPEIGTFGFATKGKGFDKVIDAVNKEFDRAVIKINIPKCEHVPDILYNQLHEHLKSYPTKTGVKVVVTNHFFNKEQLIEWCAQNTLNVFLYNRDMSGLSATTDQAITSGRPLSVSTDNTFRHIHKYLIPYPFQSLHQSIQNSAEIVLQIQKDWSPINFAIKFEKVLKDFNVSCRKKSFTAITLPIKKIKNGERNSYRITKNDFIPPIVIKVGRRIKRKLFPKKYKSLPINTLKPFVHYALNSFSQFNEDLLLDLLLGEKEKGFYIDIGTNDPSFNSNTKKFYLRGWTGINIEPNKKVFERINQDRLRDLNLNVAVSEQSGELTFYYLSDDSTLSTLDYDTAKRMARILNLSITAHKVMTTTLERILDQHLKVKEIDFMSVDAEGHDLSVLKSNDWDKFRPALLLVESNNEFSEIHAFMDAKDYLHIYSNFYNALFVDKHTKNNHLFNIIRWQS